MSRRDALNLARGTLVLLALWAYRLGRCALAGWLLVRLLGPAWALVLLLLLVALRLSWGLRIAAAAGLILLWHWPSWAGILGAAPRLLLMSPGVITTALARLRHPRPRWHAPAMPAPVATGVARIERDLPAPRAD